MSSASAALPNIRYAIANRRVRMVRNTDRPSSHVLALHASRQDEFGLEPAWDDTETADAIVISLGGSLKARRLANNPRRGLRVVPKSLGETTPRLGVSALTLSRAFIHLDAVLL